MIVNDSESDENSKCFDESQVANVSLHRRCDAGPVASKRKNCQNSLSFELQLNFVVIGIVGNVLEKRIKKTGENDQRKYRVDHFDSDRLEVVYD